MRTDGPTEPGARDSLATRDRLRRAIVVLLMPMALGGCEFERIQKLAERAQEARSEIEVELQRRAELVPSLLETAQEYQSVPADVAARVAGARDRLIEAVRAEDLSSMERASESLSEALDGLMAATAGDPGLRQSVGFGLLRSELEGIRQRIATAGDNYNEAVRHYNEYISDFPQSLTAKVIGARKLETFDAPEEPINTSLSDR